MRKPKSGRIIKLDKPKKRVCVEVDAATVEPVRKQELSGWRKTAHEQKQKLFGPKSTIGTVLPKIERASPIVPSKPVFHVSCINTGVKVVGGRLWACLCGTKPTFDFKPGQYATDAQIEERGSYF